MKKTLTMGLMFAAIAIIASSTILGASIAIQSASAQDRCVTQRDDVGSTVTLCGQDKDEAKDQKEECRDLKDEGVKCSSSQTGHGEFGNFEK